MEFAVTLAIINSINPPPSDFPDIPNYEILGRIGGGSYGEVYLAKTVTGRHRAVKVVRREDFEMEKTFEREFEGIKHYEKVSQDHPGLVDVLHVGRTPEKGFYYYVMELADDQSGQSLDDIDPSKYQARTLAADLRQNRTRSIDESISLGRSLAEALAHLHQSGLTHRDVKPSNIIFVKGEPRLADIGLVAQAGQKTYVGTEGYVPPEGPGTSSSDLYSLAMVLYEMHTGKDRLDFPELPTNHELSSTINRDEWRALNTVICRAGSPDPRKRFETGLVFSKALLRIRPGDSTNTKNASKSKGDRIFGKLLVGTSAVSLLFAIAVVGIFWKGLFAGKHTPTETPPPSEKLAVVETPIELKLPEPEPVVPPPEPEPVLAKPVPIRSVKLDSTPSGATVWLNGKEVGRTPTPFLAVEEDEVDFTFKKDGFHDKTETRTVSLGESIFVRTSLIKDHRPKSAEKWLNAQDLEFSPLTEGSFIAAVTLRAYEGFLTSTKRPIAVSGRDGKVHQIRDPELKWAFCDWMTKIDRSVGYLDETQYHAPAIGPDGDESFYCHIKNSRSTLLFRSTPEGAEIYKNDELIGTTPTSLQHREGYYQFRISKGGYQEKILSGFVSEDNLSLPVTLVRDSSILFGQPWKNSQGMPLEPIGQLMVGQYETRVRDFSQFLAQEINPGVFPPNFPQTPNDPVVKVSRNDATLFCQWLTEKERSENLIRSWHQYRLPTDREWSELAGLPKEVGKTPKARERENTDQFPWGSQWPPQEGFGNFADETGSHHFGKYRITGYRDGYLHTSPVGKFHPTKNNLYDVGGNVWEWVQDPYELEANLGVVRGAGWESYDRGLLLSAYRNATDPNQRSEQYGFRYILVDTRTKN